MTKPILLFILLFSAQFAFAQSYEADWQSLAKHEEVPEWFRDTKFGIYFHWGVYSVPAFGNEWYPRWMHDKTNKIYNHHFSTYGSPTDYGYHKFVPQFTAEKFNAEEWAKLFKASGAQYAGPVAEHHDGFAMYKTTYSPWNAVKMGPKRDLVGELEKAIKGQGLKFITTFHHSRHWNGVDKLDARRNFYGLVKRDFPELLKDSIQGLLYGNFSQAYFYEMWKGKLIETIDQYSPDIIWFDSCLDFITNNKDGGEQAAKEFLAYYFNEAEKKGQKVMVGYKDKDIPDGIGIKDYERGGAADIEPTPWMTDDCISRGSWCYTEGIGYYSSQEVFHAFIDRVSKNGHLLLNILPKADGSIPQEQKEILMAFGDWLEKYGEAIYNTRNWEVYGEGPTKMGGGAFTKPMACTSNDIRFTRNKENTVLYAILMDWPGYSNTGHVIKTLNKNDFEITGLEKVELLNAGKKIRLKYQQDEEGLHIFLPKDKPYNALAYPVKLIFNTPIPILSKK